MNNSLFLNTKKLIIKMRKESSAMTNKFKLMILLVVIVLSVLPVVGCTAGDPFPGDLYTWNIYPGSTGAYNIGGLTNPYANGYFSNLYIGGLPVGDNVTGTGIAGRLAQWTGVASIGNATNTDAQVAGAVVASHTQNTDIVLTTNGVNALINAGLLAYDLKTDRWLFDDRNTFLGVGVVGASNLVHTALIEGYENTAIGCDAASSITTGYSNTFIGHNAGEGITSGYNNTAVGADAANNVTIANSNAAFGDQALMNNTGGQNTAIGKGAMGGVGAGSYNTAVGLQALNNTTGSQNTAIGVWAGTNNTGDNNVFLGYRAGEDNTDSDKLYIDNTDTTTPLIYGDFSTNEITVNGALDVTGNVSVSKTIIAPGTTGNQTINKTAGRVNIAASGTTITVTNSLVTINSIVVATAATNDTTCVVKNVVATAGSFTINTTSATAETAINWIVVN